MFICENPCPITLRALRALRQKAAIRKTQGGTDKQNQLVSGTRIQKFTGVARLTFYPPLAGGNDKRGLVARDDITAHVSKIISINHVGHDGLLRFRVRLHYFYG